MGSGRKWSKEEEDFLLDHYGMVPIRNISNRLKRSIKACQTRYYKLTGTHTLNDVALSSSYVAEALGVTRVTINKWIRKHNFPSIKFYRMCNDDKHNTVRRTAIVGDQVWKWVYDNKERINFSQVTLGMILPEPDWLLPTVEQAKRYQKRKRASAWTDNEKDYLLYAYFTLEHSTEEISKHLQRGVKGVSEKLNHLRKELEAEGYVFGRLQGRIVIKSIPEGKKHLIKMAG